MSIPGFALMIVQVSDAPQYINLRTRVRAHIT